MEFVVRREIPGKDCCISEYRNISRSFLLFRAESRAMKAQTQ
jgi:hypothetical protein